MLNVRRPGRTPLLIFLGSAALTAAFLAVAPASLDLAAQNDYQGYYQPAAEALLRGDGYVLNGQVNLHNPPGYPFVLVVLYGLADLTGTAQVTWVTIFSVTCTALSAIVVHALAAGPRAVRRPYGAGRDSAVRHLPPDPRHSLLPLQ